MRQRERVLRRGGECPAAPPHCEPGRRLWHPQRPDGGAGGGGGGGEVGVRLPRSAGGRTLQGLPRGAVGLQGSNLDPLGPEAADQRDGQGAEAGALRSLCCLKESLPGPELGVRVRGLRLGSPVHPTLPERQDALPQRPCTGDGIRPPQCRPWCGADAADQE